MQDFSRFIWSLKYQLKDNQDQIIDLTMDDSKDRTAKALAANEQDSKGWEKKFRDALEYAIPGGRIVSNAGAEQYKTSVSLINCLAGKTQVLTREGYQAIEDIVGFEVEVLNGNAEWSPVQFSCYGEQPLIEMTFINATDQLVVNATPNHRWILLDGSTVTSQELCELSLEQAKIAQITAAKPEQDLDFLAGVVNGLLFDPLLLASVSVLNEKDFKQTLDASFNLVIPASQLSPFCYQVKSNYQIGNDVSLDYYNTTEFRPNFFPEFPNQSLSHAYLYGFVAGLVVGNGEISGDRVRLDCKNLAEDQIRYLLSNLECLGVLPIVSDSEAEKRQICLSLSSLSPEFFISSKQRQEFNYNQTFTLPTCWTLASYRGVEPKQVYCCQEPKTQSFVLSGGLLTGNCVASATIDDSMDDIFAKLHEAALTLKANCGIGYNFSTLRPKDSFVQGSGSTTSGPLSFMDVYDSMCKTISSAGGRRGAQMGALHCFSENTEVLTDKGWILVADVVSRVTAGEILYQVTLNGNHRIVNPLTKEPTQLYRVALEDGSYLEVTADHKLEVKNMQTGEIYLKSVSEIDPGVEYVHVLTA